MPLSAFDPFAGVMTHTTAVTSGLHALTVQNRCRGTATLAVNVPHERAQRVVERSPLVVADPLSVFEIPKQAFSNTIEINITNLPAIGK